MSENVRLIATGFLEYVGEDRQSGESAFVVDGLGEALPRPACYGIASTVFKQSSIRRMVAAER